MDLSHRTIGFLAATTVVLAVCGHSATVSFGGEQAMSIGAKPVHRFPIPDSDFSKIVPIRDASESADHHLMTRLKSHDPVPPVTQAKPGPNNQPPLDFDDSSAWVSPNTASTDEDTGATDDEASDSSSAPRQRVLLDPSLTSIAP